jgi:hypothetical protein
MYTYYFYLFFIITLILFISMFGAIALAYVRPLSLYKEIKSFRSLEKIIDLCFFVIKNKKCIY